jgi:hypothetical protein
VPAVAVQRGMSRLYKEGARDRHWLTRVDDESRRCRAWEKTVSDDVSRLTRVQAEEGYEAQARHSSPISHQDESVLKRDRGDALQKQGNGLRLDFGPVSSSGGS